jgi:DNA-binding NarL/FixJ family response regulator
MINPDLLATTGTDAAGAAEAPLKVFLVEDSEPLRNRLIELLETPGEVEIVGFADTEEASVKSLASARVDVAIVDLNLRSGSGFGVIKALRAQYPGPPPTIIVLTNYAFPDYEYACRSYGADFFFDKSRQFGAVKTLLTDLRARPH